jgi:cytochrome c2
MSSTVTLRAWEMPVGSLSAMVLRLASGSAATLLGLAVLAGSASGPSFSGARLGDVTEGKRVFFNRCVHCHEPLSFVGLTQDDLSRYDDSIPADANEISWRGPPLSELFGRKAGSVHDYQYPDAMKASNVNWNEDTLQLFLLGSAAFIPHNKMNFIGLKREGEMENLLAYLRETKKGR